MVIAAPTPLAFKHDWSVPFQLTREWSTDVQLATDGSEIRVQRRSTPALRCAMRCVFLAEYGAGRLLTQWREAAQPLRYVVPLWCDATDLVTALAGGESSIDCDTTDRPLFQDGGLAMLYRENANGVVTAESVTIDALSGTSGFTTSGGVVNSYPAGPTTRVVPCRIMWLALPVDPAWLNGRIFQADVAFTEERAQAAYQLADAPLAPVPASIGISFINENRVIQYDTVGMGTKFVAAEVLDAAGLPIPSAEVAWSVTDIGGGGITVTPEIDTRYARVDSSTTDATLTATSGSASVTIGIS